MHLFGLLLLVVLSSPEHLEVVQGAVVRLLLILLLVQMLPFILRVHFKILSLLVFNMFE